MKCKNCGYENRNEDVFCTNCGYALPKIKVNDSSQICPVCGVVNRKEAVFCNSCGSNLTISLEERIASEIKNRKGHKKSKIAIIIIIIALFIGGGVGSYFYINRDTTSKKYNAIISEAEDYLQNENYTQAISKYLEAIKINPKNIDPYIEAAKLYTQEKEYKKAIELLNDALGYATKENDKNTINKLINQYTNTMNNEVVNVQFDRYTTAIWDESGAGYTELYAHISGLNSNNEIIWEYDTETIGTQSFEAYFELGIYDHKFYYYVCPLLDDCDNQMIRAISLEDGKVVDYYTPPETDSNGYAASDYYPADEYSLSNQEAYDNAETETYIVDGIKNYKKTVLNYYTFRPMITMDTSTGEIIIKVQDGRDLKTQTNSYKEVILDSDFNQIN